MSARLEIALSHHTTNGARYVVTHEGRTLLQSARDPECEAARALLAKGVSGQAETFFPGGTVARMRFDIETAAGLTHAEGSKSGLRVRKWTPYQADDEMELKQAA